MALDRFIRNPIIIYRPTVNDAVHGLGIARSRPGEALGEWLAAAGAHARARSREGAVHVEAHGPRSSRPNVNDMRGRFRRWNTRAEEVILHAQLRESKLAGVLELFVAQVAARVRSNREVRRRGA